MKDLTSRLTKELQQDERVQLMDTLTWNLPVYTIDIAYETVKRTKMDILMKMMLIAFQEGEIETVDMLSDVLFVEPIFIEHLMSKMRTARMIEKRENIYVLTETGRAQLARGIFEHERENSTREIPYSPSHHSFLFGPEEEMLDPEEELEDYRHIENFHDWHVASLQKEVLLDAVKKLGVESVDGHTQTVVAKIVSAQSKQVDTIPCVEFRLYHTAEDIMYARVWNTRLARWDETLENELHDKDRKQWREKYLG